MKKYDNIINEIRNTLIASGLVATLGLGYLLYNKNNEPINTKFFTNPNKRLDNKINKRKKKLEETLREFSNNENKIILYALKNKSADNLADKYTLYFMTNPKYSNFDKPTLTGHFIDFSNLIKNEYNTTKTKDIEYRSNLIYCLEFTDRFLTKTKIRFVDYLINTKNLTIYQNISLQKEINLIDKYFHIKKN